MTAAAVIERLQVRDLEGVALKVCRRFNVTLADTVSTSRDGDCVRARHALWLVLRTRPEWPMAFAAIARLFNVNHKTVMYGVEQAQKHGKGLAITWQELGQMVVKTSPVTLVETGNGLGKDREEAGEPSRALASRALSDQDLDLSQSSSLSASSKLERGGGVGEGAECISDANADAPTNANAAEANAAQPFAAVAAHSRPGLTRNGNRKRPATSLPDDFEPTPAHFDLAKRLGLSTDRVAQEVAHFRDYAIAKDARYAQWPAAFAMWLRKAKGFERGGNGLPAYSGPARREMPGRFRTRDDAEPHVMQYRELKDEPGATGGPPKGQALAGMIALIGNGGRT